MAVSASISIEIGNPKAEQMRTYMRTKDRVALGQGSKTDGRANPQPE
jgi:hypothetical protein